MENKEAFHLKLAHLPVIQPRPPRRKPAPFLQPVALRLRAIRSKPSNPAFRALRERLNGRRRGIYLAHSAAVAHGILLPAELTHDILTFGVAGMTGLKHASYNASRQRTYKKLPFCR